MWKRVYNIITFPHKKCDHSRHRRRDIQFEYNDTDISMAKYKTLVTPMLMRPNLSTLKTKQNKQIINTDILYGP